jgi:hypothetical protein
MSPYPNRPPATPAVELRILDPGGDHLTFAWQVRNGYGHLLASGQTAGAPVEVAGWRYHALAEAAHAAITALQQLEAAPAARTCDFCATTPAAWRYPIAGGQLAPVLAGEVLVMVPGGDWYACPACHHLIQAGQWAALSAKAGLPAHHGAALWAGFQAARSGNPIPLHPRPNDPDQGGGR